MRQTLPEQAHRVALANGELAGYDVAMGDIIKSLFEFWDDEQRWRGYQKERMYNKRKQIERDAELRARRLAARRARRAAAAAARAASTPSRDHHG
jgi:hypothetical protein